MSGSASLGFVFDQNRCTGCQACELACMIENDLGLERSWRTVHTFNERHFPGIPVFHLSLACNHCAEPGCLSACPTRAYHRDTITGAVLIDEIRCTGCRYCTWACPYGAPRFDPRRGVVDKCTLCNDRLKSGLSPACASLCPTGALNATPLTAPYIVQEIDGLPPSDMRPSLKILPLQPGRSMPECSLRTGDLPPPARTAPSSHGVELRSEWPLLIFSCAAIALFVLGAAHAAAGVTVSPWLFAAISFAGMALGAWHLGNLRQAWRIVLHIERSWLSREIVLFFLFGTCGTLTLTWAADDRLAAWTVAVLGAATLTAIDRVYAVTLRRHAHLPHSASTLLTGAFLAAAVTGQAALAGALGLLKLTLYLQRKLVTSRPTRSGPWLLAALRILLGFLLPPFLWIAGHENSHIWILISLALAELLDRCEFYLELELTTPGRQMERDIWRQGEFAAIPDE